jgi:hypothetical protein
MIARGLSSYANGVAAGGIQFTLILSSSGSLGPISRLTEVEDGRVQCGRLLVNAGSSKLNLELT